MIALLLFCTASPTAAHAAERWYDEGSAAGGAQLEERTGAFRGDVGGAAMTCARSCARLRDMRKMPNMRSDLILCELGRVPYTLLLP